MKCQSCGKRGKSSQKFCEHCGSEKVLAVNQPEKKEMKSTRSLAAPEETPSRNLSLELIGWKPWGWLFMEKYGLLKISDDHVIFDVSPTWSIRLWRLIAKLTFWGFDWLSFFRAQGHSQLKNISVVVLISPEWVIWRFNFLLILGPGHFGVYPVGKSVLEEARIFSLSLREHTLRAKYFTVNGKE